MKLKILVNLVGLERGKELGYSGNYWLCSSSVLFRKILIQLVGRQVDCIDLDVVLSASHFENLGVVSFADI